MTRAGVLSVSVQGTSKKLLDLTLSGVDCVLPPKKVEFPLIRLPEPVSWRIPMTETLGQFLAGRKAGIVRGHLKDKERNLQPPSICRSNPTAWRLTPVPCRIDCAVVASYAGLVIYHSLNEPDCRIANAGTFSKSYKAWLCSGEICRYPSCTLTGMS